MTDLRTPPRRALPPDPDDEEEVDLGRYWRAIAARWWLLLAGAVIGILIGYLVSLGSGQVWQGTAVLYLGNPLTVGGNNPVQGLQQNPRTVNEIVHSEAAITTAAARCGMRPGQIRGNVSTKGVSAGRAVARAAGGGGQLVQVTVQGDKPQRAACPANVLAERVVERTSGYVDTKIETYEARLATQSAALASMDALIRSQTAALNDSSDLTSLDRLVLITQLNNSQQQRAQLVDEQSETEQLLALAQDFERSQVVERAVARKTTARSPRNAMLVGGALGLLIGAILALLWDQPFLRRLRREA